MRNLVAGMERLMEDLPRPDRAKLVEDLSSLTGRSDITVREGRLTLSVPIPVALDHVMSSALITAASLIRVNAETVVRAAAVLDAASFEVWVLNAGHLPDPSAQGFELGAHGAALRHGPVGLGEEMQGDGSEEIPGLAVLVDDALGEKPHQVLHEVAEDHLVPGKAMPGHPEPLVPRRSTPPP
ncbi:hypothetical protein [Xanthobacter sp. 91]|uniref:hypothetical protein n=1 Tax=Xanthobacter sp. 91 TaxID=1117244 RepID=UPI0012DEE91C|nr:hypothetical protein [Xanthobacter sp. 91]